MTDSLRYELLVVPERTPLGRKRFHWSLIAEFAQGAGIVEEAEGRARTYDRAMRAGRQAMKSIALR